MTEFELLPDLYIVPTPMGAYHAASSATANTVRSVLARLMRHAETPLFNQHSLYQLTNIEDEQQGLEQIYRLQEMGFVQAQDTPLTMPVGTLENILPDLLSKLSGDGNAMLADEQGFCLATQGFKHEVVEEIASLSADLAALHTRHQGLLDGNLGLNTQAWALSNAGGVSKIGFWPLFVGQYRLVLIIEGMPNLNKPAMRDLIWMLFNRYDV